MILLVTGGCSICYKVHFANWEYTQNVYAET